MTYEHDLEIGDSEKINEVIIDHKIIRQIKEYAIIAYGKLENS